jgi:hypothetical protein
MNYLARLRLGKPQLAGQFVYADRLSELRLGKMQLTILLAQLLA